MWFRCEHFENKPGAMQSCRQSVNQQENIFCWNIRCYRNVGNENSATNRFLQVLVTSSNDRKRRNKKWTHSNNRVDTKTRQQEETNIEPQLNHRPPTEQEKPNSQQRLAHFDLGFRTSGEVLSLPQATCSLESRRLSSEGSRLHGLIAGGGRRRKQRDLP